MGYNSGREERLHCKASLHQLVELQRSELQKAINGLSEQQLKSAAAEQLVANLADRFSINIPVLDEAHPTPSRSEVDIERPCVFGDRPTVAKGTEITISVPYTGDAEIFRIHPSSHVMNYPLGRIAQSAITFLQRGVSLDPAHVRQEFDAWLAIIRQHLEGMRKELGNFNDAIKTEIAAAISGRLEKLKRDDDLLNALGFDGKKAPQ